jgi:hypothetical protein
MLINIVPKVDSMKEDILEEQAVAVVRQQFALQPNEMAAAKKEALP